MTPAESAKSTERHIPSVMDGSTEQFAGYSLLALPLSSGYVFAFRRCTTSSIGPPYTSVWQRDARGRWTFHVDVMPQRACPRYFGPALHDVRVGAIDIAWKSQYDLSIYVHAARLHVALRLGASPATRLVTAALCAAPAPLWRNDAALELLGRGAGAALCAGPLAFSGHVPAGHRFRIQPRAFWQVRAAVTVCDGRDLGAIVAHGEPAGLGDFIIPESPLFAVGQMEFKAPYAHSNRAVRSELR